MLTPSRSRRANGATQTFRRPSLGPSPSNASSHRDTGASQTVPSTPGTGIYIPPHRNGALLDSRYGKDQLLQLFKSQKEANDLHDDLSALYVGGWEPNGFNSSSGNWGRRDESARDGQSGVDVCWDLDGAVKPLSLEEITEEEKEASLSINDFLSIG
jgi:PERQ amino acid-rich with GYF domain-containing protein